MEVAISRADAALQQAVLLTETSQLAAAEAAVAQAQHLVEHAQMACIVLGRHVLLRPSSQERTAAATQLHNVPAWPRSLVAAAADNTEGESEVTSKQRDSHVAA